MGIMHHRSRKRAEASAFIELLASVAILGVLAMLAVPVVETSARRAERAQFDSLNEIRTALDGRPQDGNSTRKNRDST